MAEHQIEARILLRYDTLTNWNQSTVILKQGEAAIAAFPFNNTIEGTNDRPEHTPPAIGIKIGDGYHYFNELPWVQGVAGDVYTWAKQQNKPTYSANEIQGLATFVQQYISGGGQSGDVTVEARTYRLAKIDNKYYLQSRGVEDDDWVTDQLTFIDLSQLAELLTWLGTAVEDYWTITGFTNQKIIDKLNTLNYTDTEDQTKVVTAVDQINGKISVTRRPLSAYNLSGTISVGQGGTGRSILEYDSVLVGNGSNAVALRPIETTLINNNNLATNRAIINYINTATAGLTGAMHYIGEATVDISQAGIVNPQIDGYNFNNAQLGDVVVYNYKEYVWEGGNWRLLGDEGSYAVKGSITDADIADNANISQSKVQNLTVDLSKKVDKVEGKTLTSNDFTIEYKNKLDSIEDNAQVNIIENIFLNDTLLTPQTVIDSTTNDAFHKSVVLNLTEFTDEEKEKLANIEIGAQVNTIQSISVNGSPIIPAQDKTVEITIPDHNEHINKIEEILLNGVILNPNQDKQVNIVIDENAVQFRVLAGARVPTGITSTPYEDVAIDENSKKLELARIAATGRIYDIVNTPTIDTTDYLILRCGDASTLI